MSLTKVTIVVFCVLALLAASVTAAGVVFKAQENAPATQFVCTGASNPYDNPFEYIGDVTAATGVIEDPTTTFVITLTDATDIAVGTLSLADDNWTGAWVAPALTISQTTGKTADKTTLLAALAAVEYTPDKATTAAAKATLLASVADSEAFVVTYKLDATVKAAQNFAWAPGSNDAKATTVVPFEGYFDNSDGLDLTKTVAVTFANPAKTSLSEFVIAADKVGTFALKDILVEKEATVYNIALTSACGTELGPFTVTATYTAPAPPAPSFTESPKVKANEKDDNLCQIPVAKVAPSIVLFDNTFKVDADVALSAAGLVVHIKLDGFEKATDTLTGVVLPLSGITQEWDAVTGVLTATAAAPATVATLNTWGNSVTYKSTAEDKDFKTKRTVKLSSKFEEKKESDEAKVELSFLLEKDMPVQKKDKMDVAYIKFADNKALATKDYKNMDKIIAPIDAIKEAQVWTQATVTPLAPAVISTYVKFDWEKKQLVLLQKLPDGFNENHDIKFVSFCNTIAQSTLQVKALKEGENAAFTVGASVVGVSAMVIATILSVVF